ncbi:uncharacterized protein BKA55DRAFT_697559 [Fusarium redolens]|uniref:Uncharacterized protein n=1 Tax=Fusarium redolens TaxID=48865 RepID=A0A9P9FYP6_FUSRE|nr:uncharacterized protein BKA55DRAFT_697559 [Fusarium redolens]KAH7220505.1 hypothetical protein BKA55DRAFT_697559 [Fusarium redolens]
MMDEQTAQPDKTGNGMELRRSSRHSKTPRPSKETGDSIEPAPKRRKAATSRRTNMHVPSSPTSPSAASEQILVAEDPDVGHEAEASAIKGARDEKAYASLTLCLEGAVQHAECHRRIEKLKRDIAWYRNHMAPLAPDVVGDAVAPLNIYNTCLEKLKLLEPEKARETTNLQKLVESIRRLGIEIENMGGIGRANRPVDLSLMAVIRSYSREDIGGWPAKRLEMFFNALDDTLWDDNAGSEREEVAPEAEGNGMEMDVE